MAVFDEKALRAHLKEKSYLPCYLFVGEEEYLKRLYAGKIADAVVQPAFSSFNVEHFDGKGLDLRDVFDHAAILPMMDEKRVIVVDDYKLDPLSQRDEGLLQDGLASLPDTTILIFTQELNPVSKKTGKKARDLFSKYGAVCELEKRSGQDLYRPLIASAQKQGCALSTAMAQYLVSCVGDDFNVLIQELSKVCAYAQGEITKAHIDAVATKTLDAKVYALSRALLQHDFDKAYAVLDTLVQMRVEPYYILGALNGAYLDLYRAKTAVTCAGNIQPILSAYSYKGREFALQNAARDAARLSMPQLRKSLEALLDADRKLKSTGESGTLIMEQLLVRLSLIANGERV